MLKRSTESLFKQSSTSHIAAPETTFNQWPSVPNTPMDCDGDRTSALDHYSFMDSRKASDLKHILNDSIQNVIEAEDHSYSDESGTNTGCNSVPSSSNASGSIDIKDEGNVPIEIMIQQLRERGYEITEPSSLPSSRITPTPKPTGKNSNLQDHSKKQNTVTCQLCGKFNGRPCEVR